LGGGVGGFGGVVWGLGRRPPPPTPPTPNPQSPIPNNGFIEIFYIYIFKIILKFYISF